MLPQALEPWKVADISKSDFSQRRLAGRLARSERDLGRERTMPADDQAPLGSRTCASCGAHVSTTARFCEHCGAPLEGAQPAPPRAWPEERKLATILFADIVGFTAISTGLEADTVRELANYCFNPLSQEIARRGGTVIKYIGDCIMAAFGVPRGAEDDPRRAVAAALAMMARLEEISPEIEARFGMPINVRIGLNTGQVMVGAVGSHQATLDVMGSTVNLASRLQNVARPGQVVISASVLRQARDYFEVEPLGSFSLKGFAEPVEVHRVLGERAVESFAIGPASGEFEIPFLLREAEFTALTGAFA